MAKKKQDLSPEERLAAALVPEEEWPYTLPDGWNWVRIGALNDYKSSSITPSTNPDDTFELYSVPSIVNDYPEITKGMDIGSTKQLVEKDDVLLCKINPRINRVWKVSAHTTHKCLASSEWIVVRVRSFFASDYLMWFFRCPYFRERMLSNVSGVGGSLMRAKPRYVQTYPVALPPLSEQHRLVARIESLFAKLDAAREQAQSVLDSHEPRKAALLHDAFAGKLTAKWRKEHGIAADSWYTDTLKELCAKITDGTHHSPPNTNKGDYMYVTAKNIKETGIMLDNITYVSSAVHDEIYSRCDVKKGDVLYIKDGATTGIATVNTLDEPFSLLSSVAVLRPHEERLLPGYLKHLLNSSEQKSKMLNNMSGNAITRLTLSKIKATSIKVCSLSEQHEIVSILDRLLGWEEEVRQSAESVLAAIDRMKQAILARAFRGEL